MKQLTITLLLAATTLFTQAQPGEILSVAKLDGNNNSKIKDDLSSITSIGRSVENIGDLDQNGVNDIAVGGYDQSAAEGVIVILFLNNDASIKSYSVIGKNRGGLNSDIPNSFEYFGQSIAGLGDLDGDGVNDIAVGNDDLNYGGELFILFMNNNGSVKSSTRIASQKNGFNVTLGSDQAFGVSLALINDLDGDNIPELAVGDDLDDDGNTDKGAIYILYMNNNGTVKKHKKISQTQGNFSGNLYAGSHFGSAIAQIGIDRIAVGAYRDWDGGEKAGAVWILDIDKNGLVTDELKITENSSGFNEELFLSCFFGTSISNAGDINGDGIDDLLVGANEYTDVNAQSGACFLLFMKVDGTVNSHIRYSNSSGNIGYTLNEADVFGTGVTGLGDINGDNKYDIAVGIFGLDQTGGSSKKGGIHIFFLDGKEHVGINNVVKQTLSLYPNPANTSITISTDILTTTDYTVSVYDVAGRQVLTQTFTDAVKQPEVNIESLENGMYQVIITTSNQTYQGKLVVQH